MHVQEFIRQDGVPVESALRVYRRYLKLEPSHAEEYVAYLQAKVLLMFCVAAVLSPLTSQEAAALPFLNELAPGCFWSTGIVGRGCSPTRRPSK